MGNAQGPVLLQGCSRETQKKMTCYDIMDTDPDYTESPMNPG